MIVYIDSPSVIEDTVSSSSSLSQMYIKRSPTDSVSYPAKLSSYNNITVIRPLCSTSGIGYFCVIYTDWSSLGFGYNISVYCGTHDNPCLSVLAIMLFKYNFVIIRYIPSIVIAYRYCLWNVTANRKETFTIILSYTVTFCSWLFSAFGTFFPFFFL